MAVTLVRLATALIERDGRILLAASQYPNHPKPLWNLPGGRARAGESYLEAMTRELAEETGLVPSEAPSPRYSSESKDRATETYFVNVTFGVTIPDGDEARLPLDDAHVVAIEWVARTDLASRLSVRVVREPLLAHLADPTRRYFPLGDAGITVVFNDAP